MMTNDVQVDWKSKYEEQYALCEEVFNMLYNHKFLDHDSLRWHDKLKALKDKYLETHVHLHG